MMSLTPFDTEPTTDREDFGEVQYLLRRATEEAVAAIRATDVRAGESHAGMAESYSTKSLQLIARLDGAPG